MSNPFKNLRANASLLAVASAASRAEAIARREHREYHANITANYRRGSIPYEVDCTLRRLAANVEHAHDLAKHLNRLAGNQDPKPAAQPLAALRHHVTGAIERGEAQAIAGIPAKPAAPWRCDWSGQPNTSMIDK